MSGVITRSCWGGGGGWREGSPGHFSVWEAGSGCRTLEASSRSTGREGTPLREKETHSPSPQHPSSAVEGDMW